MDDNAGGPGAPASAIRHSPVADVIATFMEDLSLEAVPSSVRLAAKRSILDTLAVAIAGSRSRAGRSAIAGLVSDSRQGVATVIGTPWTAHPSVAAVVNGTIAHALDYDDVWADDDGVLAWRGHPSVCVLPGVLAAAEMTACDGETVLLAYIIGVEVAGKLGTVFGPHLGRAGFHPTAILGAIGTAAGVGRVLRVKGERARMMLGLAATAASGLTRNFGTDTKPFHAGHAAQGGLQAALMAGEGFTANPEALMACLALHHGPSEVRSLEVLRTLGLDYDLLMPGLSIKKYPCCRFAHLSLDALFTLLAEHPVCAAEVETITIRIQPGADDALLYRQPKTGLEGKFSMEYVLAASVLDGELTLASFTDEQVRRPAISDLMRRVFTEYKQEPGAEAVLRLKNGAEFRAAQTIVRGDPANPLAREELLAKCHQCLGDILPGNAADSLVSAVDAFEDIDDVRKVTALTAAPSDR